MERDGKILLRLINAYGEPLREKVDIMARNLGLTDDRRFRAQDASAGLLLSNLIGPPRNRYLIEVSAPSYLPVRRFLSALSGDPNPERVLPMPVDAGKVTAVDFPDFATLPEAARILLERSGNVLGYIGAAGEELFQKFDNIRRAGLLNIIAKANRTRLSNGRTVLSYLEERESELLEARGDRFFAKVPKQLREETKNSVADQLFDPASSTLHKAPKGFSKAGSYKTPDGYGNLQLTFFAKGQDWVADIDIDDAGGLEHVFQVVRNILSGRPTHPYDIHEILLIHQELDPGYRFNLG